MNINSKVQKFIYWFLSCTWGIVMTFVGLVVSLVLIITKHKPKKFGWNIYFNVGKNWGGLELGPIFLTDTDDDFEIKCHEHGHGFQNIIMGPFFPLIVGLRSATRYWLYEIRSWKNKVIFCVVLCLCALAIVGILFGFGVAFNVLWLLALSECLFGYVGWFFIWLCFTELPDFKERPYPIYDSFWVEGQATEWGKRFISNKGQ